MSYTDLALKKAQEELAGIRAEIKKHEEELAMLRQEEREIATFIFILEGSPEEKNEIKTEEEIKSPASTIERIREYLTHTSVETHYKQIAKDLDLRPGSVASVLSRHKDFFEMVGHGFWRLKA